MAMKPEDVPAELVEKATRAMWNAQVPQAWQMIDDGDEWPSWVDLATRDRLREKVRHALAAVLPEIQTLALQEFADGLPAGWKRPNGPADAARAHAAHLLECTCPAAVRLTRHDRGADDVSGDGPSVQRVCVRCGRHGVQQYVSARQDGTPAVMGEAWVCSNEPACRRRAAERGSADVSTIHPPARRPCASCPYRVDVPSGVWDRTEYEKLPAYDEPTALQPMGVFLCHQVNGRVCAGWVGCHDMTQSLGVRLAIISGLMTADAADALCDYTTDVPLFTSCREAAEHGMQHIDDPAPDAERVMDKIVRRRATTDHPIGEPT